jgi:hypothetical protein
MNAQPVMEAHEISEAVSGQSSASSERNARGRRVNGLWVGAFIAAAMLVFGWFVAFAIEREAVADDVVPAAAPPAVIQKSALSLSSNAAGDGMESSLLAARRLSDRDIVNLTRSQVSSQYIVALIHRLGDAFEVDSKATAELRRAGVAEDVIAAMLDSTVAANVSALAKQTNVPSYKR